MSNRSVVAGLLGVWFVAASASDGRGAQAPADTRVNLLADAQRAFDRGSELRLSNPSAAADAFQQAAEGFQRIVDSGVRNGRLFYNLANAYLQSGHIGRAILNYRRADRLIPRDPRAESNLSFARSLRRNDIPASAGTAFLRTLFFWHFSTSLRGRFVAGVAVYLLFWFLLILRTYSPRRGWAYAIVPLGLVWFALGISVMAETRGAARQREGVILVDDVVARKGNGEGFEPQFEQKLHEGVEFILRDRRDDWLNIELPDGKTGWIRAREAELI